ncbi:MAG: hypothetical protein JNK64_32995 [Myxococcales bacterium]|nr:hypothetical protein [Myxococcales bacterium]
MGPSRWYVPRLLFAGPGPGQAVEREVLIAAPTALDAVARAAAWAEALGPGGGEFVGFAGMAAADDERPDDGVEFGGWFREAPLADLRAKVAAPDDLAAVRAERTLAERRVAGGERSRWYAATLVFAAPSDEPTVIGETCQVLFEAADADAALVKAQAWASEHAAWAQSEFLGVTRLDGVAGGRPDDGSELVRWSFEVTRDELATWVVHPTALIGVRLEGVDGHRPIGALMTDAQRALLVRAIGEPDDGDA